MTTTPAIKDMGMGMVPVPALGDLLITVYMDMVGMIQAIGAASMDAASRDYPPGEHRHYTFLLPTLDQPYSPCFTLQVCAEYVEGGAEMAADVQEVRP